MSKAFTSYQIFEPLPRQIWEQCQVDGCVEPAKWKRLQGALAEATEVCTKHKKEFEQQEESEQV